MVNGARAVGGGGGGIGFPAAGAAEGAVRPVMAEAWCCRAAGAGVGAEAAGAAGRVAARGGGGCREPTPMLEAKA